jgi:3D (Asp-Asp-Asp) domain-containing protein
MLLARSSWLKVLVTGGVAGMFVWLLEATILDSVHSMLPLGSAVSGTAGPPAPTPGVRVDFTATAYCKGLVTSAGVAAQAGVVASDPSLLPTGSVIQLDGRDDRYDGIYTVLDTGPAVQGREIDIYMWSCHDALKFGRRPVRLTVLRLGWSPRATTPSFMERLFRRPEPSQPAVLPSRPLPVIQ